jgi:hypothetical protein
MKTTNHYVSLSEHLCSALSACQKLQNEMRDAGGYSADIRIVQDWMDAIEGVLYGQDKNQATKVHNSLVRFFDRYADGTNLSDRITATLNMKKETK